MRAARGGPALLAAAALVAPGAAGAHEMRPAYVELHESTPGAVEVSVRWRPPDSAAVHVRVRWPAGCTPAAPVVRSHEALAIVERYRVRCEPGAPWGETLAIEGLAAEVPSAVVRATPAGGEPVTRVVRAAEPRVALPSAGPGLAGGGFFAAGLRHIAEGFDHLAFVFGLLLVALRGAPWRGLRAAPWRELGATVTAFTVAHSLTLGLASFGAVSLSPRGVEAAIALSILALACELARPAGAPSLAGRHPWVVAFGFGLLHGFGFAGALAEAGVPRAALPAALLWFNAGVEVGQLAFVAACLCALAALRRLASARAPATERLSVYALGALAAYWCADRSLSMLP